MDEFITDDDMSVEWLAQVFEVAGLRSRSEEVTKRRKYGKDKSRAMVVVRIKG
jgi:hypothetical protein